MTVSSSKRRTIQLEMFSSSSSVSSGDFIAVCSWFLRSWRWEYEGTTRRYNITPARCTYEGNFTLSRACARDPPTGAHTCERKVETPGGLQCTSQDVRLTVPCLDVSTTESTIFKEVIDTVCFLRYYFTRHSTIESTQPAWISMIYLPKDSHDTNALATAATRGRVRSIVPGLYTDDLTTPAPEWVQQHLWAVLAGLYPDWYVSYSTAALGRARDGVAFISGASRNKKATQLPGVLVKRIQQLPHPETITVATEEVSKRTLSGVEEPIKVRRSSPLQNVFEVLRRDARQPERGLPLAQVRTMIQALSLADRQRAERFAERNKLRTEYNVFKELSGNIEEGQSLKGSGARAVTVYFYHYRVGQLEELTGGEIRFSYADGWPVELSCLPKAHNEATPAYEGVGLPPFFDNLLPEGWAEARLRAVYKIPKEDLYGLLTTTSRYLSNLTLRPEGFDTGEIALDELSTTLATVIPRREPMTQIIETIGRDPDTRELWIELKRWGATGLSGVQAKLPVHLSAKDGVPQIAIGESARTSTHILKLPSREYPELVANEWATMELARRMGLDVADARQVEFQEGSPLGDPALLIERFDIPQNLQEADRLLMLEEAASLLCLRRAEKYTPSLERIIRALTDAGLDSRGMESVFDHVLFSWLIGNGDLHAKNIAVMHGYRPGRLGATPTYDGVTYAPLYDLVNTRIVIRGDLFALPVNGKQNNLRTRDFVVLGRRIGWDSPTVSERVESMASAIDSKLDEVLAVSGLSEEMRLEYARVVRANIEGL